jgi:hypothetical protein
MFPKRSAKFFSIIAILFIATLFFFINFRYFNFELNFSNFTKLLNFIQFIQNDKTKNDNQSNQKYNFVYTNKVYLNENLNLLKNYFYQAFNEYNQSNFKIIYSEIHNYSILNILKRVSKANYDYIYVEILPVIRLKKIDNSIIKKEAKVYSDLLYNSIYLVDYLVDKNLKKELNLKEPIKIIVFDYNKIAIEK